MKLKRMLSLLLSLAMCLSLVAVPAYAKTENGVTLTAVAEMTSTNGVTAIKEIAIKATGLLVDTTYPVYVLYNGQDTGATYDRNRSRSALEEGVVIDADALGEYMTAENVLSGKWTVALGMPGGGTPKTATVYLRPAAPVFANVDADGVYEVAKDATTIELKLNAAPATGSANDQPVSGVGGYILYAVGENDQETAYNNAIAVDQQDHTKLTVTLPTLAADGAKYTVKAYKDVEDKDIGRLLSDKAAFSLKTFVSATYIVVDDVTTLNDANNAIQGQTKLADNFTPTVEHNGKYLLAVQLNESGTVVKVKSCEQINVPYTVTKVTVTKGNTSATIDELAAGELPEKSGVSVSVAAGQNNSYTLTLNMDNEENRPKAKFASKLSVLLSGFDDGQQADPVVVDENTKESATFGVVDTLMPKPLVSITGNTGTYIVGDDVELKANVTFDNNASNEGGTLSYAWYACQGETPTDDELQAQPVGTDETYTVKADTAATLYYTVVVTNKDNETKKESSTDRASTSVVFHSLVVTITSPASGAKLAVGQTRPLTAKVTLDTEDGTEVTSTYGVTWSAKASDAPNAPVTIANDNNSSVTAMAVDKATQVTITASVQDYSSYSATTTLFVVPAYDAQTAGNAILEKLPSSGNEKSIYTVNDDNIVITLPASADPGDVNVTQAIRSALVDLYAVGDSEHSVTSSNQNATHKVTLSGYVNPKEITITVTPDVAPTLSSVNATDVATALKNSDALKDKGNIAFTKDESGDNSYTLTIPIDAGVTKEALATALKDALQSALGSNSGLTVEVTPSQDENSFTAKVKNSTGGEETYTISLKTFASATYLVVSNVTTVNAANDAIQGKTKLTDDFTPTAADNGKYLLTVQVNESGAVVEVKSCEQINVPYTVTEVTVTKDSTSATISKLAAGTLPANSGVSVSVAPHADKDGFYKLTLNMRETENSPKAKFESKLVIVLDGFKSEEQAEQIYVDEQEQLWAEFTVVDTLMPAPLVSITGNTGTHIARDNVQLEANVTFDSGVQNTGALSYAWYACQGATPTENELQATPVGTGATYTVSSDTAATLYYTVVVTNKDNSESGTKKDSNTGMASTSVVFHSLVVTVTAPANGAKLAVGQTRPLTAKVTLDTENGTDVTSTYGVEWGKGSNAPVNIANNSVTATAVDKATTVTITASVQGHSSYSASTTLVVVPAYDAQTAGNAILKKLPSLDNEKPIFTVNGDNIAITLPAGTNPGEVTQAIRSALAELYAVGDSEHSVTSSNQNATHKVTLSGYVNPKEITITVTPDVEPTLSSVNATNVATTLKNSDALKDKGNIAFTKDSSGDSYTLTKPSDASVDNNELATALENALQSALGSNSGLTVEVTPSQDGNRFTAKVKNNTGGEKTYTINVEQSVAAKLTEEDLMAVYNVGEKYVDKTGENSFTVTLESGSIDIATLRTGLTNWATDANNTARNYASVRSVSSSNGAYTVTLANKLGDTVNYTVKVQYATYEIAVDKTTASTLSGNTTSYNLANPASVNGKTFVGWKVSGRDTLAFTPDSRNVTVAYIKGNGSSSDDINYKLELDTVFKTNVTAVSLTLPNNLNLSEGSVSSVTPQDAVVTLSKDAVADDLYKLTINNSGKAIDQQFAFGSVPAVTFANDPNHVQSITNVTRVDADNVTFRFTPVMPIRVTVVSNNANATIDTPTSAEFLTTGGTKYISVTLSGSYTLELAANKKNLTPAGNYTGVSAETTANGTIKITVANGTDANRDYRFTLNADNLNDGQDKITAINDNTLKSQLSGATVTKQTNGTTGTQTYVVTLPAGGSANAQKVALQTAFKASLAVANEQIKNDATVEVEGPNPANNADNCNYTVTVTPIAGSDYERVYNVTVVAMPPHTITGTQVTATLGNADENGNRQIILGDESPIDIKVGQKTYSTSTNRGHVASGETVTLTLDAKPGHTLTVTATPKLTFQTVTNTDGTTYTYTFTMPDESVTIAATYTQIDTPAETPKATLTSLNTSVEPPEGSESASSTDVQTITNSVENYFSNAANNLKDGLDTATQAINNFNTDSTKLTPGTAAYTAAQNAANAATALANAGATAVSNQLNSTALTNALDSAADQQLTKTAGYDGMTANERAAVKEQIKQTLENEAKENIAKVVQKALAEVKPVATQNIGFNVDANNTKKVGNDVVYVKFEQTYTIDRAYKTDMTEEKIAELAKNLPDGAVKDAAIKAAENALQDYRNDGTTVDRNIPVAINPNTGLTVSLPIRMPNGTIYILHGLKNGASEIIDGTSSGNDLSYTVYSLSPFIASTTIVKAAENNQFYYGQGATPQKVSYPSLQDAVNALDSNNNNAVINVLTDPESTNLNAPTGMTSGQKFTIRDKWTGTQQDLDVDLSTLTFASVNGWSARLDTSANNGEDQATYVVTYTQPSGGGGGGGAGGAVANVIVDRAANGRVKASNTSANAGDKVTVTMTPDSGYEADTLTVKDKNGKEIAATKNSDGTYTFTMPAASLFPVTVTGTFKAASKTGFVDVDDNAYYAAAVEWAVKHDPQITNGTDATHFSPEMSCTRGHVVTFLWRAAGAPEPKTTTTAFTDLGSTSEYYYKAVLWAVENGITNGTSATTFSPNVTVTRGQVVTFLYRYEKATSVAGSTFTDVATDAYYAPSVNWAYVNGITKGTSETTFSPENDCTRAQIVTFLYRDMVK